MNQTNIANILNVKIYVVDFIVNKMLNKLLKDNTYKIIFILNFEVGFLSFYY